MNARLVLIALLVTVPSANLAMEQRFDRTHLGDERGGINAVAPAHDGGFVAAGYLQSVEGPADCVVFRYDDRGRKVWRKTFGEANSQAQVCARIRPFGDGFVVGGYTSAEARRQDAWVFGLSADGRKMWQIVSGGKGQDEIRDVISVDEHRLIAVGSTSSNGKGNADGFVMLIDSRGGVLSTRTVGGPGFDFFNAVTVARGDDVVIVGESPPGGDVRARPDVWVVRYDTNGMLLWEKRFGTPHREGATAVLPTATGGVIVAGTIGRLDADGQTVPAKSDAPRGEPVEGWLVQLDVGGNKVRELRLGGAGVRGVSDLVPDRDGLLAVGPSPGDEGYYDTWMGRFGLDLSPEWNQRVGAQDHDYPSSITRTTTGVVVVGGWWARRRSFDVKPWIAGFSDSD